VSLREFSVTITPEAVRSLAETWPADSPVLQSSRQAASALIDCAIFEWGTLGLPIHITVSVPDSLIGCRCVAEWLKTHTPRERTIIRHAEDCSLR